MTSNRQLFRNLGAAALITILLAIGISMISCTDNCENSETYVYLEPVYTTAAEVRASYASLEPRGLENPGKIYRKDHYLFINEFGKGIHIFNNNDKTNPQALSFLNIPGSFDVAVKGNIMYVDSFVDLLVLDISDPTEVKLIKRLENVVEFVEFNGFWSTEQNGFVTDFVEIETVQVYDCDEGFAFPQVGGGGVWLSLDQVNRGFQSAAEASPGSGLGGSFARFAIYQDYLYVVDNWSMHVFDVNTLTDPARLSTIELGWGIETIFPYNDKLFIGSNTGMQIFDNSAPQSPQFLSTFNHAQACDPVVAQGHYAYVTLRSGNACFGITDQLDVIDISNIQQPLLVKTYLMESPHGLAIDDDLLFLCEGEYGLKVFNVADKEAINDNLLSHLPSIPAYDVIAIDSHLILVGAQGIYQFDYSNPEELKLLSVISIQSES
ncbi:MAG: hypothetical protein OER04_02000 [Cyclobacteriaceae bacterium]|nr:hypothetical protein [Cyclobacteriaceae bacterium]